MNLNQMNYLVKHDSHMNVGDDILGYYDTKQYTGSIIEKKEVDTSYLTIKHALGELDVRKDQSLYLYDEPIKAIEATHITIKQEYFKYNFEPDAIKNRLFGLVLSNINISEVHSEIIPPYTDYNTHQINHDLNLFENTNRSIFGKYKSAKLYNLLNEFEKNDKTFKPNRNIIIDYKQYNEDFLSGMISNSMSIERRITKNTAKVKDIVLAFPYYIRSPIVQALLLRFRKMGIGAYKIFFVNGTTILSLTHNAYERLNKIGVAYSPELQTLNNLRNAYLSSDKKLNYPSYVSAIRNKLGYMTIPILEKIEKKGKIINIKTDDFARHTYFREGVIVGE